MHWRRWGLPLALVVLAVAALVYAQSTRQETVTWNFVNGLKVGGSTTLTGTAGTGAGSLMLPINSVSLGREVSGFAEPVTFCGQLVNATTVYLGPGLLGLNGTPTDYILGGTACDAMESATEATADAPISTLATKIVGMRCKVSNAPGTTKIAAFTLRTDAADAVTTDGGATTIGCSIVGAATECRSGAGSTTNIAASGTLAVKVVTDYDASTHDGRCVVLVSWP